MDIPIVSKDRIDEIDKELREVRPWFPLSQEEYQKWNLLKKCLPILHKFRENIDAKMDNEVIWAFIAFKSISDIGVCIDVLGPLRLRA
jgi:hypothetical protein